VAHQADHLAGADVQVQAADHRAVAVAEAHALHLDAAPASAASIGTGLRRLGHVGHVVEDVEDALGAGRRLLRDRDDAAHRIEPV
jgi:hypothetical protein